MPDPKTTLLHPPATLLQECEKLYADGVKDGLEAACELLAAMNALGLTLDRALAHLRVSIPRLLPKPGAPEQAS